jgi:hypothetical protein
MFCAFAARRENSEPFWSTEMNQESLCVVCSQPAALRCPCRAAVYCGKQCQKKAWKKHKPECAAVLRPARWFDWSERQLAEQCIEFLLNARTMAEDGRPARHATQFAKKMLDEQGVDWLGLSEFKTALMGARRLFRADPSAEPDDAAKEELKDDAQRLAQGLVDAARRMINDDGFEQFLWPWANQLFEPVALVG